MCVCSQAGKKAGLSDDEIKDALEMAASDKIKNKLKGTTKKALDYGVSCYRSLRKPETR